MKKNKGYVVYMQLLYYFVISLTVTFKQIDINEGSEIRKVLFVPRPKVICF